MLTVGFLSVFLATSAFRSCLVPFYSQWSLEFCPGNLSLSPSYYSVYCFERKASGLAFSLARALAQIGLPSPFCSFCTQNKWKVNINVSPSHFNEFKYVTIEPVIFNLDLRKTRAGKSRDYCDCCISILVPRALFEGPSILVPRPRRLREAKRAMETRMLYIVFEKLRFRSVFRPHGNEKPAFSNSSGLKSVLNSSVFVT